MTNFKQDCEKIKILLEQEQCYEQSKRQYRRDNKELKLNTVELPESDVNASEYITFEEAMIDVKPLKS